MASPLGNLYCLPNDVFDSIGVDGVQLRLDDQNLATGQTITVLSDAAQGATTLQVTALQYPLLRGSSLQFAGGGTTAVTEAQLTAVSQVGSTTLTVNPLPNAILANAQAKDNGVNLAMAARLAKGCQYGTNQVRMYCTPRYDDSQLYINAQQQGSVNRWATALASRWVQERRNQGASKGVQRQCEEALEELRMIQKGAAQVENIGTRTSGWPFIVASTLDVGYEYNKIRIEPQLSEGTPTQFPEYVDWNSLFWIEW